MIWPLVDNEGTDRDLVEYNAASGTTSVVDHLAYNSFGAVTSETNSALSYLFGYTGFVRDLATGLDHSQTRDYDPLDGIWTQEDPLGFGGGQSNISEYAGNGPTNGTDRGGLAELNIADGWTLYPNKTIESLQTAILDQASLAQKTAIFADGKATLSINFTALPAKASDRDAKLAWLGGLISLGLGKAGYQDAQEHFDWWRSGKGSSSEAPKLPIDKLKQEDAYKELLNDVKTNTGVGDFGSTPVNEGWSGDGMKLLMGAYSIKWKRLPDNRMTGEHVAEFIIDDRYDFTDKTADADITTTKTKTILGKDIEVTLKVHIPDKILIDMRKACGRRIVQQASEMDRAMVTTHLLRTYSIRLCFVSGLLFTCYILCGAGCRNREINKLIAVPITNDGTLTCYVKEQDLADLAMSRSDITSSVKDFLDIVGDSVTEAAAEMLSDEHSISRRQHRKLSPKEEALFRAVSLSRKQRPTVRQFDARCYHYASEQSSV